MEAKMINQNRIAKKIKYLHLNLICLLYPCFTFLKILKLKFLITEAVILFLQESNCSSFF